MSELPLLLYVSVSAFVVTDVAPVPLTVALATTVLHSNDPIAFFSLFVTVSRRVRRPLDFRRAGGPSERGFGGLRGRCADRRQGEYRDEDGPYLAQFSHWLLAFLFGTASAARSRCLGLLSGQSVTRDPRTTKPWVGNSGVSTGPRSAKGPFSCKRGEVESRARRSERPGSGPRRREARPVRAAPLAWTDSQFQRGDCLTTVGP